MAYTVFTGPLGQNGNLTATSISVGSTGVGYTSATVPTTGVNGNITWNSTYAADPKVLISDGDITLDGMSLRDFMRDVQERLAILVPNPKLESDFEELKELRAQYKALENELLEKAKMWETLKKE